MKNYWLNYASMYLQTKIGASLRPLKWKRRKIKIIRHNNLIPRVPHEHEQDSCRGFKGKWENRGRATRHLKQRTETCRTTDRDCRYYTYTTEFLIRFYTSTLTFIYHDLRMAQSLSVKVDIVVIKIEIFNLFAIISRSRLALTCNTLQSIILTSFTF